MDYIPKRFMLHPSDEAMKALKDAIEEQPGREWRDIANGFFEAGALIDADEFTERLAALCHSQWSGWMEYLFSQGSFNGDGTWTMPAWAVERWTRQMETDYAELSESEKNSDRAEAAKFLELIQNTNA